MENVYFAGKTPPKGNYKVRIKLDNPSEVHGPVKVRFGGRIGVKTFSLDVQLAAAGDAKAPAVARSEAVPKSWVPFPSVATPGPAPSREPSQKPPYTVETALGVVGVLASMNPTMMLTISGRCLGRVRLEREPALAAPQGGARPRTGSTTSATRLKVATSTRSRRRR